MKYRLALLATAALCTLPGIASASTKYACPEQIVLADQLVQPVPGWTVYYGPYGTYSRPLPGFAPSPTYAPPPGYPVPPVYPAPYIAPGGVYPLADVAIYGGSPEHAYTIEPDYMHYGEATRWTFRPLGRDLWVQCRYAGTPVTVVQPLPNNVQWCRVRYERTQYNAWIPGALYCSYKDLDRFENRKGLRARGDYDK